VPREVFRVQSKLLLIPEEDDVLSEAPKRVKGDADELRDILA